MDALKPCVMTMKGNKSSHKEAHSAQMKKGMGDYYGTAVKAKIGKMRPGSFSPGGNPVSEKKLKIPPRSLA